MAKGHGVKLEDMEIAQILELKTDIQTELQGRYNAEESRLLEMRKALGMDEEKPKAKGKGERATKEEMAARVASVLDFLKGTTKDKGKSKAEILEACNLPEKSWIGLTLKMKKEGLIDSFGKTGNAVWFLAAKKGTGSKRD